MWLIPMNIALYARVSTTDQSCAMQLHERCSYAAKRGWQVFELKSTWIRVSAEPRRIVRRLIDS